MNEKGNGDALIGAVIFFGVMVPICIIIWKVALFHL